MELVGNTFFFDWEVSLILWLQAHMGAFGTSLASFLSAFGEELACVAMIDLLTEGTMKETETAGYALH